MGGSDRNYPPSQGQARGPGGPGQEYGYPLSPPDRPSGGYDYPQGSNRQLYSGDGGNGPSLPLRPAAPYAVNYANNAQVPSASPRETRSKPPLPKRKPESLRHKGVSQGKQIQDGIEDISFTKDDIIIAIMGVTGAGKSTFISLLSDEKIEIGHGLQSCTTKVGVYYFTYNGVRIFLVDTPGFDDTNRSDSEVLKDVAFWLAAAYSKQTRLAGIIYLHRISDDRMPGSALRNLRMFNKLCGENNLNSVVLATTHWTNLKTGASIDQETGEARTNELVETKGFWGGMVENGSQVVKHDGTRPSALEIVLNIVGRQNRVILDIQRQLIDEKLDLNDTDAAQALQSELIAERKRFEKQLTSLKEEMEDAIRENDLRAQHEIKKEQAKAEAEIKKTRDETNALRTNLEKIAKEKDEQFRKLQEEMAQQRREYQDQLKKTTAALEAEKEQQRRRAEQHERERREDEAKRVQQAEEHQRSILEMHERMRHEHDQAVLAQMEKRQEEQERWYQRQQEDARAAEAAEERRWERQLQQNREREEALMRRRDEADARIKEIELEQRKRAWYNPMRWLDGKYRD